jgi:hypothetical protein
MFFDPIYLLFALPGLLLSMIASAMVKSTFAKYSRIPSSTGYTGAQAAEAMLRANGVFNVRIERTNGFLSDHYDPTSLTLRLSDAVYSSNSLSAVGVACHEAGHALQHADNYAMLGLRSALVPVANFGSTFSYIVIVLGLIFNAPLLLNLGCILFGAAVLFSIVTLPVEWDASARAKVAMVNAGLLQPYERDRAGSVLNAAFMTYVAAAVSAIMTLLYYILRAKAGSRR